MPDEPLVARYQPGLLVFGGLGSVAITAFCFDLGGLQNGGGLFSITRTLSAVQAGTPSVDVDRSGLITLFVAVSSLVVTGLCLLLRVRMAPGNTLKGKLQFMVFFAPMLFVGYELDSVFGPKIVDRYMVDHGYTHCRSHDHLQGQSRGLVSFNNYVLIAAASCSPADIT